MHQGSHLRRVPLHVLRRAKDVRGRQGSCRYKFWGAGDGNNPPVLDNKGEAADDGSHLEPRLQGAPHPRGVQEVQERGRMVCRISTQTDQKAARKYANVPFV